MDDVTKNLEGNLYTIGHSTHEIGRFTAMLQLHRVTAVYDVRSQPWSRFNPQFNREILGRSLEKVGIVYVFLGRRLGARAEDRGCYVNGAVQFDLLACSGLFQEGLDSVVEGVGSRRVALMCAEKDPLVCHRAILVCRHLATRGITAQHILEDGRLESHDQALTRLLVELGLAEPNLFRTRDDLIAEAYDRRGRQIAYTEEEPSPAAPVGKMER